jgi:hypothetical protein
MWWQPRNDGEAILREAGSYLQDRYRDHLRSGRGVVRGVGSGAPVGGQRGGGPQLAPEWRPLVLIDDRSLPLTPQTPARIPFESVDRDSLAYAVLRDWNLQPDTLVQPVGPVIPAVAPGAAYTPGQATVGLPVVIDPGGRHGFLTVAHGITALQVSVTTLAGATATGQVVYQDDSARGTGGGDDIALVEVLAPATLAGFVTNQGVQPPPSGPPYPLLPVDMYGSSSGRVIGQVNGALLQLGDQQWQWLDCWELGATQPSMSYGDSGSLALAPPPNSHVLGHFVGGALSPRMAGFSHHWVQDLGQVLSRHSALGNVISF